MTLSQITAPYGFVPLGSPVFPRWLQTDERHVAPPVHDIPFREGLCGTLELEIDAETPIFTRGSSKSGEEFFRLPDGRYAIPGTALRGALRNVVEIATFSRFAPVNDHRYAVRDLNNRHLYGRYMADIVNDPRTGKGEPMPLVNAGWLRRTGDGEDQWRYEIEVCDFAKIEYRKIMQLAGQRGLQNYEPGRPQPAVDKYASWKKANAPLEVEVEVDFKRPENLKHLPSRYGTAIPKPGGATGTLVFTGQPARWTPGATGKKHHDFVFLPRAGGTSMRVTQTQFEDFEFAHSDRGQQNKLRDSLEPNKEWGFWKIQLKAGGRVPIFFLNWDDGTLRAFGLAMMFRLSYQHSIQEAIKHQSSDHMGEALDFAEGVFGTVRRGSQTALKGRVGISHAVAIGSPQPMAPVHVILGGPKASYYPNYVEQDPAHPGSKPGRDAQYATWMDANCVPRGWKRYKALTATWNPPTPSGADGRPIDLERSKVGTKFHPLPAGTSFRAHVDVHNLLPEELGALLWALDFGGDAQARHTLGMARPLGYGRVKLSIVSHAIRDMEGQAADFSKCRSRFEAYMSTAVTGWKGSHQIRELLALARPVQPSDAYYQVLDPGQGRNDFQDAKKAGLALPSAAGFGRTMGGSSGGSIHSSGQRPPDGRRPTAPASRPGGDGVRTGDAIQAVTLEKTTNKGDPKFRMVGADHEGILHPQSGRPPEGFTVGKTYDFVVAATGKPLQLKWGVAPDGGGGQRAQRRPSRPPYRPR